MMSPRRPPLEELPRLPPGQHGLPREEVEASQRTRLQLAMVQAVAEHGYASTKIRELARIAGVSPNAFYELYESKEECFLDTHDAIARIVIGRVAAAAARATDWDERLHAAIDAFIETVVAEPRAAQLVVVEVHAVGARALEHQQQTLDAHERLVREILDEAPHGANVPDTTVKAIVAGARGMIQHHIAAGRPAALRTLVAPINDWVLSYHTPHDPDLPEPLSGRRRQPARLPRASPATGALPSTMGHRERIMRAVAALSCENGYGALRMPLITAAAGVSNQTFYEHFANKHDAFMACYDRISRRALAAVLASFQAAPDWPRAIRASLQTLLSFVAAEPEFARLALFEVLAAGPEARLRAEARTETFTAMMTPGSPSTSNGSGSPRLLAALVSGGAWGVIQHHIIHGRTRRLAELTPNLTYMALTPFVGAAQAAEVARGD